MAVPAAVTVLVAVLAAAVGVVIGAGVVRWKVRGDRHRVQREGPTVAELLARLVRRSQAGIAVVNRFGDVVLSNERAEELAAVVDARPHPKVAAVVDDVVDGEPVEVDLSPTTHPPGRTPQSIIAQVRPLGDGFVVVDATDTSAAVRLEAVRRDFVANVGHELKTPVGALAVLAEAVLDADDPDEIAHFANKILHESRRLGSLVTELIELSRLQGAEKLPALTRVDVDEVLDEALGRVRLSTATGVTGEPDEDVERARFVLDDPSGLTVAGDRTLLITALTNLLENAVAYSPDGSPVSVRRRASGDHVEVSVIDRGIGIAPEHQQRVFERFFRVDQARSRATGGTGLGLAIVKHVAANHGGEVRLWSEPGVGSTFTLRVPAPSGGDRTPARPQNGAAPGASLPGGGTQLRPRPVPSSAALSATGAARIEAHTSSSARPGTPGHPMLGAARASPSDLPSDLAPVSPPPLVQSSSTSHPVESVPGRPGGAP